MKPDQVWAYIAGLIEGEGWIGTARNSSTTIRRRAQVAVSMTDEDVVMRLPGLTGLGRSVKVGRKTTGGKDVFRWTVTTGADVLFLLQQIMPFLGSRRFERAALVMDYAADSRERLVDLRERGVREIWADYRG